MALQFTRVATLDEARELTLEEMLALGLMPPIAGAEDADDSSDDSSSDDDSDDSSNTSDDDADSDDADADDSGDKDKKLDVDWRKMARKHEREAKKLRTQNEKLAKDARARQETEKSEQQKAIDKAREDAKAELQTEHEKERRQDRLETASTRIAAKGVTFGEGDKAKTVKFADPDDAMVYLERAIKRGDVDHDDLFDNDGRVKQDALEEALTEILEKRPHLGAEGKKRKVNGSADTGKGRATDPEDGSVEDDLKHIRRYPNGQPAGASSVVTRRQ